LDFFTCPNCNHAYTYFDPKWTDEDNKVIKYELRKVYLTLFFAFLAFALAYLGISLATGLVIEQYNFGSDQALKNIIEGGSDYLVNFCLVKGSYILSMITIIAIFAHSSTKHLIQVFFYFVVLMAIEYDEEVKHEWIIQLVTNLYYWVLVMGAISIMTGGLMERNSKLKKMTAARVLRNKYGKKEN
jgi:hypothetical protein